MKLCNDNLFPIGELRYDFDKPVLKLTPYYWIAQGLQEQMCLDLFLVCKLIISDHRRFIVPKVYRITKTEEFLNKRRVDLYDVNLAEAPMLSDVLLDALPDNVFEIVILFSITAIQQKP